MSHHNHDIKEGEKIIKEFITWLGLDVNSPGIKDTPKRVAKYYLEAFEGLYTDKPKVTVFESKNKLDYVCVSNIPIVSWCEHHLLPFTGKCGVVYYSKEKKLIGLSKIVRLVNYFSARPNTQENLTSTIADELMNLKEIKMEGVYVIITAQHSCMIVRGVKAKGSFTNTAAIRGDIDKKEAIELLEINNFFNIVE